MNVSMIEPGSEYIYIYISIEFEIVIENKSYVQVSDTKFTFSNH